MAGPGYSIRRSLSVRRDIRTFSRKTRENREICRLTQSGENSLRLASSPSRTRTYNKPVNSRNVAGPKSNDGSTSGELAERFVRRFAQELASDRDLAYLVEAWATLPDPIRRTMLALLFSVAVNETE